MAEGGFKRASAYELHADTDKMSLSDEVQMQANTHRCLLPDGILRFIMCSL